MEWGSDVARYVDAEGLRAYFPQRLVGGPRVLKPNYGNGGRNVWRVQLAGAGDDPALETWVEVPEARQGSKSERISLAECLDRWVPFLNGGGVLIDQRSEEHTYELQSLMRNSYAVFCLKHKKTTQQTTDTP